MSRWWRAYDEAVNDPKIQLMPGPLFKAWFNLLCVASGNGGTLPHVESLAFTLKTTEAKIGSVLEDLIARGLVDDVEGVLRPHNWNRRQYKSDVSTERVKEFRERERNVSCNGSVTPPEKNRKTDTDSEAERKKEETRACALDFRVFYEAYPHKVGKQAAVKAFEKARKSGRVSFPDLMAGLARYVAKTDDRPWCNPATWLNEGRWDDQPAQENINGKRVDRSGTGRAGGDFLAGLAKVATSISGDGPMAGPASEEVPLGRVNIEG